MQPREIDELIAEKVMGWKKDQVHPNLRGDGWWEDEPGSYTCEVPEFSTDPAASKLLRDRMRELGWQYTLGGADGQPYIAKFWNENGGDWLVDRSDTEEMAVALAALKALGVEITE